MVAVRSTFLAPNNKSPKTNLSVVSKKSARRQKLTYEENLSHSSYASENSRDSQIIQEQNLAQVISLPKSKPLWLKSLMATQLTSSMVTVLLASTSVAIYGWTIYGQSKWTTEYQKLQKLRQKEQQISVANELLKNQIAEQASNSDNGLVSQNSVKRIFLDPAPPRPAPNAPKPYLESTSGHKYLLKTPVGY
ncbi:MAG: hypothetical protein F6K18_19105 [Okeania sp. SIO2C2]|uniref:hypothetical protein n=1 Tax=Okeania sp. SIO2C2 TaxID=2607787 RepID=UPI0013BD71DB|nr:hypothetical protein [Okeania sp. SIO2C2]NEP88776.1 hypothetical protein [Okeania sp. SIO2C2]